MDTCEKPDTSTEISIPEQVDGAGKPYIFTSIIMYLDTYNSK